MRGFYGLVSRSLMSVFWIIVCGGMIGGCSSGEQTGVSEKEEVRIGRLICGGHLSLAVVENRNQGRFEDFRLVTVQNHRWDKVVEDLEYGRLDGTFILSPLAMNLIRNGLKAKIVLMADRNGNGFVLSRQHSSIESLAGSHAIIAVPHRFSQHHVLLYLALQQHHVPYHDISVVAMAPRDMINSLRRGEIDGFVVGEPEANKSISLGVGWMAAISPQIWKDHLDHVFILTDRFIREHPERAARLVQALQQAGQFIEVHPKQAALLGEDYTGSSAQVFEQVLTTPPDWIDFSDMRPTFARVKEMAQVMVEMGLWDSMPPNLAAMLDLRFLKAESN